MRSVITAGALFLLSLAPLPASTVWIEPFSGLLEVPPVPTPATGIGNFVLNNDQTRVDFTVTYSGLTGGAVVGAHFHNAPPGANGPIVRGYDPALFPSPSGTVPLAWTATDPQPLTPALVAELLAGRIYFNIHTQQYPMGEIRANLDSPVPEPGTWALLASGLGLIGLAKRRRRA
jgi:hypothetical protein